MHIYILLKANLSAEKSSKSKDSIASAATDRWNDKPGPASNKQRSDKMSAEADKRADSTDSGLSSACDKVNGGEPASLSLFKSPIVF